MNCLMSHLGGSAAATASYGKWVFVVALALLLIWLIAMPRRLIGQADGAPPWWRDVRFWAIVVTVVQILIYAWFG